VTHLLCWLYSTATNDNPQLENHIFPLVILRQRSYAPFFALTGDGGGGSISALCVKALTLNLLIIRTPPKL